MGKVIVFATPVFLLLIALEYWWGKVRAARGTGHNTYGFSDAINSISLGVLSQVSAALSKTLTIGIYTAVFAGFWGDEQAPAGTAFWNSAAGYLAALIFYDFCYYWLHRAGHEVALFWAAHGVHHQSQHYNLSTALRQTSSGAWFGWIFYLPMALAGVPPLVFGIVALVDLLYQFWVHTEQVGKLGWFDRVFCSPSNHRVHHAVNDRYIDRNYGGVLVVWDRLFGTFQEETEPCVYGTRTPLQSWDPLWANASVYWALAKDTWRTRRWSDKLRIWLKPPGWLPADLAAMRPHKPFDVQSVTRFEPPLKRSQQWFAAAQFLLVLGAVALFLWNVDTLAWRTCALWSMALVSTLWVQGLYLQNRATAAHVVLLECATIGGLHLAGALFT